MCIQTYNSPLKLESPCPYLKGNTRHVWCPDSHTNLPTLCLSTQLTVLIFYLTLENCLVFIFIIMLKASLLFSDSDFMELIQLVCSTIQVNATLLKLDTSIVERSLSFLSKIKINKASNRSTGLSRLRQHRGIKTCLVKTSTITSWTQTVGVCLHLDLLDLLHLFHLI